MAVGWFAPGTVRMTVRFTPGLQGYLWLFPRRDHVAIGISAPLAAVPTRELLERLRGEVARDFPAFADEGAGLYAHTIPTSTSDPRSIRELAGERCWWRRRGPADPITGKFFSALTGPCRRKCCCNTARRTATRAPARRLRLRALKAAARPGSIPGFTRGGPGQRPDGRAVLSDPVLGSQGYLTSGRRLLGPGRATCWNRRSRPFGPPETPAAPAPFSGSVEAMASGTWLCPNCKRRVPAKLDDCRCGFLRIQAEQAETREAEKARMPWDIWAALGVMALALILGVVWVLQPAKRNSLPALLGYSTSGPSPAPTKAPVKSLPPKNR
jgi:hypothetical protein